MGRIASFHLVDEPAWKIPIVLTRLGADRIRLPRVPGLEFWRLLGTGSGDDTGRGADLSRSAVFAVWGDESDLDTFLADGSLARRWRRAEQSWHVRLRSIGGHGTWKGVDPLAGLDAGSADGPVAIITRANVRRHSWKAFGAASEVVDAELHQAPGLIDVVGHRRDAGRCAGDLQSLGIAVRRSFVRLLDARSRRGDATDPRRGLVRRGDVRPLRALRVHGHLERPRPARRARSTIAVVTIEAHR